MVVGVEVERRKKSDDTRTKKEEKMIAKQQQRIPGGFRAKPDGTTLETIVQGVFLISTNGIDRK